MFKQVVLFALLGLAQAGCVEDTNTWCAAVNNNNQRKKMPSMEGVETDELNEIKADCADGGKIATECTLAEGQQLASMLGGTGAVA